MQSIGNPFLEKSSYTSSPTSKFFSEIPGPITALATSKRISQILTSLRSTLILSARISFGHGISLREEHPAAPRAFTLGMGVKADISSSRA